MQDLLSKTESTDLGDLWQRRQQLSPEEMGRMYAIVTRALHPCAPSELRSLDESKQELIAQFIYAKVLRLHAVGTPEPDDAEDPERAPATPSSAPSSAVALCAYFKRYLIDCTRASRLRRRVPIGEDGIGEAQLEAELGANDEEENALRDHGLNDDQVKAAARCFIAALPAPERLLLCEGFGQELAGGLSGVASRHRIASYHYRAGKLGLVHMRAGLPRDYGHTLMGSWIQKTLGITIERENMSAIHRVFKILALEASCVS
ncbi:MAG: hypothetical protein WBC18_15400 [Ottowia sp.]|uniref:hypothetical protein n=1 Tax=Ottowia sp. TaxID=1898956 RepID=UPI003C773BE6